MFDLQKQIWKIEKENYVQKQKVKRYGDRERKNTFRLQFPIHSTANIAHPSFLLHVLAQEVACLSEIGLLRCLSGLQHVCLAKKFRCILHSAAALKTCFVVTLGRNGEGLDAGIYMGGWSVS